MAHNHCCDSCSCESENTHNENGLEKKEIIQLSAGVALFVFGLIFKQLNPDLFWGYFAAFVISYLFLGGEVILTALKNIAKGQIFDENFLMGIATVGAFAIGDYPEAVAVMLFYQVGEYFQGAALRKSKKSITALMDIRPDYANLKQGSDLTKVAPETVRIGDFIVVKPGEKIPLDGIVTDGESMLDTSALTGESVPHSVKKDDNVLSGCINQSGLLTVKVTKEFSESTVAKIIDLVENASSKKAPSENFITTFAKYYTPAVVGFAALLALLPPLFLGGGWNDWIGRSLIFLVISCPCALVISIPLGFFGGIGAASHHGILIKGGNYLEALNNVDTVVFDKTGTLTKGIFEVKSFYPANGFTKEELLSFAAKAESFSSHPIATSVMKAYGSIVNQESLQNYEEISGHGIRVTSDGRNILVGNDKMMKRENITFVTSNDIGTKVYVAVDGIFAGSIIIADDIKPDSRKAILGLKEKGVRRTVILTGDNQQIGQSIAETLGLDEVHAQLLPAQKVEQLERLDQEKPRGKKLVFVGDGINDAPVLARADIGIAMGGLGSDAAIEAADVVLMTDEPSKLVDAIIIARMTKKIVVQNIAFALGVKGLFLLFGAFGYATLWEAVFADVGVALIAILNAMRVLKTKKIS
ncbi:MAG: cadmium-translocating P-type ATPase [Clostridiales bacterium 43-6]|nr:MAG: cadmium-translocating P-type ATPase [Clostridiales bacterium 43-6]